MSDPEDFIEEDDLFGDDDGEVQPVRQLSDEELDSGDDEDRNDRTQNDDMDVDTGPTRAARIMDVELGRQTVPLPADGEIHTFRLPNFLGLDPIAYNPETFQMPDSDHHSKERSSNFSPVAVAESTIRYRKDPETGKLQSNTLISRWSDGSVTIHVGDNDYELLSKPLAPSMKDPKSYQEALDTHTYLVAPHSDSQILQVVGHITNQYTVQPNKEVADVALERLTSALQATKRARLNLNGDKDNGIQIITQTADPELQRKEAEAADREKAKIQRRRENAAAKAEYGGGRRSGGLAIDDLEGRSSRMPGSARKKRPLTTAPKRARKSRADFSSDEDDRPGRHREDEYDMEDDFLAASDEEEAEGDESEEDIDDGIVESPRAKKTKTKRDDSEDEDADADADGEPDDDAPAATASADGAGRRKRLIIEDDEDDE